MKRYCLVAFRVASLLIVFFISGCAHDGHTVSPKNPRQAATLGIQALKAQQYTKAHRYFNYALRYNPKSCHLNFLNGLAYHMQSLNGDYNKLQLAKAGYQLSFKMCPSDPWPAYYLGLIAQKEGQYDKAKTYYLAALAHAPKPVRGSLMLAAIDAAYESNDKRMAAWLLRLYRQHYPHSAYLKKITRKINSMRSPGHIQSMPNKNTTYKQCMVNAVIIVMRHVDTTNKGVNLLKGLTLQYSNSAAFNSFGTNGWDNYDNKTAASDNGAYPTVPFSKLITNTISVPAVTYDLNIFNHTGEYDEILARPSIMVEDGQEAKYFSGTNLILGIQGTQEGQIQTFPLGVTLKVKPKFEKDGSINMHIDVGRNLLTSSSNLTTFNQVAQALDESTHTTVDLHFGQTVILSMLSETVSDNTRNKVPGLGEVPLLGDFFSNTHHEKVKTSVLFLLTPVPAINFYSQQNTEKTSALTQGYYNKLVKPSTNMNTILDRLTRVRLYSDVADEKNNARDIKQAINSKQNLFSLSVAHEEQDISSQGLL